MKNAKEQQQKKKQDTSSRRPLTHFRIPDRSAVCHGWRWQTFPIRSELQMVAAVWLASFVLKPAPACDGSGRAEDSLSVACSVLFFPRFTRSGRPNQPIGHVISIKASKWWHTRGKNIAIRLCRTIFISLHHVQLMLKRKNDSSPSAPWPKKNPTRGGKCAKITAKF